MFYFVEKLKGYCCIKNWDATLNKIGKDLEVSICLNCGTERILYCRSIKYLKDKKGVTELTEEEYNFLRGVLFPRNVN